MIAINAESLLANNEVDSFARLVDCKLSAVAEFNSNCAVHEVRAANLIKRNTRQVDNIAVVGAAYRIGAVAVRVEESILARAAN